MKATIEFNLDDSDDAELYYRMNKATDMAGALWDITHNTKKALENEIEFERSGENKEFSAYDALDLVFERIHEILADHDVNPERLYR
jgi:hypothetical protein